MNICICTHICPILTCHCISTQSVYMYLPYPYMSLYIYPICIHVSALSLHVIVYLPYLYTCIGILTCHCISTLSVHMYLPYSYMSLYIYPICTHVSALFLHVIVYLPNLYTCICTWGATLHIRSEGWHCSWTGGCSL